MKIFYKLIIVIFFILNHQNSYSLSPEEKIPNQELENRAMELFLEVRCLVCNGQVIENSDTKFAYDMRKYIRNEILNNQTNDQIKTKLIEKFGDDILISPSNNFIIIMIILSMLTSAILFLKIKLKNKI